MTQDAQFRLLIETVAEMHARLRVLDEAYARLEAMAEHQLELLEILVTHQLQGSPPVPAGASSGVDGNQPIAVPQAGRIVDDNGEYTRDTHPALFKVVGLLERDERARTLSVRQLAQETGVSKSWCAIAKRHVLREESVQWTLSGQH